MKPALAVYNCTFHKYYPVKTNLNPPKNATPVNTFTPYRAWASFITLRTNSYWMLFRNLLGLPAKLL